jgi:hypothetical protein
MSLKHRNSPQKNRREEARRERQERKRERRERRMDEKNELPPALVAATDQLVSAAQDFERTVGIPYAACCANDHDAESEVEALVDELLAFVAGRDLSSCRKVAALELAAWRSEAQDWRDGVVAVHMAEHRKPESYPNLPGSSPSGPPKNG